MSSPEGEKGISDKVLDLAKARLEEEIEKKGLSAISETVAPVISYVKEFSMVRDMHDEIQAMPPELQEEFLDGLARRTIDQEWWRQWYDQARMLMPMGVPKVLWEKAKDGTLAGLIMLGAVGTRAQQEAFALRAQPGMMESILMKALPWIIKLDPEPDTKAALTVAIQMMKAKGMGLEVLKLVREGVERRDIMKAAEAELKETQRSTEDQTNLAQLPVPGDKKTPEQIHVEQALGPDRKAA